MDKLSNSPTSKKTPLQKQYFRYGMARSKKSVCSSPATVAANFPNATEKEISAMLETLMYDVTYNRLSKQQQGQQGIAGPSHQQQNLQVVNSYRDDQFTRMLKNMLQTNTQKGGENSQRSAPNSIQMSQQRTGNQGRVGINQMNQQRTGNQARVVPNQMNHQRTGNTARLAPNQMNQQRTGNPIRVDIDINQLIQQRTGNQARGAPNQMNQQRIGNQARVPPNKMNQQRTGNQGRVAPNQQSLGFRPANQQMIGNGQIRKTHKTSQETYRDEMRRQQEANFARLRNQRRFQTPTTQQSTGTIGQQPIQNGNSNQPPIISRVRDNNGLQRTVNRQPNRTQTQQVQNQWKSMQTLNNRTNQPAVTSNRLQQMQNKQEAAINRLNSQQERRAAQRVAAEQSITQKKNQREVAAAQLKTQKQYQKDRFQQQIQQKQQIRQQTHQQNTQPKKVGSVDPVQRQLEDMKKRYKATRSTTSKPISIVEIDDEPGT